MVQRLAQLISNPRRAGRSERRERPDCTCDRRRDGWAQYLRNYIANPYLPPAPPQSPGTFSDPFGTSFDSPPKLFESKGGHHGNLNTNPYDPNVVADPFGRCSSP